jgi:hypothetical protein
MYAFLENLSQLHTLCELLSSRKERREAEKPLYDFLENMSHMHIAMFEAFARKEEKHKNIRVSLPQKYTLV